MPKRRNPAMPKCLKVKSERKQDDNTKPKRKQGREKAQGRCGRSRWKCRKSMKDDRRKSMWPKPGNDRKPKSMKDARRCGRSRSRCEQRKPKPSRESLLRKADKTTGPKGRQDDGDECTPTQMNQTESNGVHESKTTTRKKDDMETKCLEVTKCEVDLHL